MSPSRHDTQPSMHSKSSSKNSYTTLSAFCTEENVSQCISYIEQEVSSLGFPSLCGESSRGLSTVPVLNTVYELLQLHRRGMRTLEDLETEQLKSSSDLEYAQLTNSRLKDQLEFSRRENSGLHERERQLQLKVKSLQNCLKNEKEEVQKLQSIIASRATQYNHDMKRKEREYGKLKERLNQLITDKKDKKLAIEILNCVGRSDGKRGLWKTGKTEARHEGEMYKTLLNDYENRQKDLMVENAELKKVLQQMKKEMVSILSPGKHSLKGEKQEDDLELVGSDNDEELYDSSRETLELSCEHAREQLTNSIRQQWRRLKNHVEKLDNQASLAQMDARDGNDVISRETHVEELEKLRLEIQECKDVIQTQQQLLQHQLSSPCDDETAALLNDCYMLEEKERLKEEWKLFEEQRKNFEKERKNFTEAAIRLGRERKVFEEDRATWLKHQFLNMTPFAECTKSHTSKSQSALSVCAEPVKNTSTAAQLGESPSHAISFTSKAAPVKTTPTKLSCAFSLITDHSSTKAVPKRGSWQDSNIMHSSELSIMSSHCNGTGDRSIFSHAGEHDGRT